MVKREDTRLLQLIRQVLVDLPLPGDGRSRGRSIHPKVHKLRFRRRAQIGSDKKSNCNFHGKSASCIVARILPVENILKRQWTWKQYLKGKHKIIV